MGETAVDLCRQYAEFAAEVDRLTDAIRMVACPNETEVLDFEDDMSVRESCFQHARSTMGRYRSIHFIGSMVKDCPECSRLVELIAARRTAKRRHASVKGRIRKLGNALIGAAPYTMEEDDG